MLDRPSLRLVHTSDVHIGDIPDVRLAGLRAVIDAAFELDAHALLIVGDLFDSARVTQPEIDETLRELARLRIPVIVTNGNHDALEAPSIWERVDLRDAGDHVYFLGDPDGSHAVFPELKLTVWARAMVTHEPSNVPLAGYSRHIEDNWQVGMAHGHYFGPGELADRSSPILAREIEALNCDYLALGHWHRFLDVSANGTAAYYCGCPSEAGGSFPSANLVLLDPVEGVSVERIPLPERTLRPV
jgi:DNA repair exonuclease SbcCD nuclease subunit